MHVAVAVEDIRGRVRRARQMSEEPEMAACRLSPHLRDRKEAGHRNCWALAAEAYL